MSIYASRIANVCIIIFPLFFASVVFTSFTNEEHTFLDNKQLNVLTLENEQINTECSSKLVINVAFAIVLAALWNAKKIIKIGTI